MAEKKKHETLKIFNITKDAKVAILVVVIVVAMASMYLLGEHRGKQQTTEIDKEVVEAIVHDRTFTLSQELLEKETEMEQMKNDIKQVLK